MHIQIYIWGNTNSNVPIWKANKTIFPNSVNFLKLINGLRYGFNFALKMYSNDWMSPWLMNHAMMSILLQKRKRTSCRFTGSGSVNGEEKSFCFHIKQISSFKFWMLLVLIKNKTISFRCKSLLLFHFMKWILFNAFYI